MLVRQEHPKGKILCLSDLNQISKFCHKQCFNQPWNQKSWHLAFLQALFCDPWCWSALYVCSVFSGPSKMHTASLTDRSSRIFFIPLTGISERNAVLQRVYPSSTVSLPHSVTGLLSFTQTSPWLTVQQCKCQRFKGDSAETEYPVL